MRQWERIKTKGDRIVNAIERPKKSYCGFLGFLLGIFDKLFNFLKWLILLAGIGLAITFATFLILLFK